MTTGRRDQRLERSFKQHTAVDDRADVVVDVLLTTGRVNEGLQLLGQLERVETHTGTSVQTVTADKSYAHAANYHVLEQRQTDAVIPPQGTARRPKHIPGSRFKYDTKYCTIHCPCGKTLMRKGCGHTAGGWRYRANAQDFKACSLRPRCFPAYTKARVLVIKDGHEALLRA